MLEPYKEWEDNTFAIMAQIVIFFSLVSAIALSNAATDSAISRGMDAALVTAFCIPILFECWIDAGFSCRSIGEKVSKVVKTWKGTTAVTHEPQQRV